MKKARKEMKTNPENHHLLPYLITTIATNDNNHRQLLILFLQPLNLTETIQFPLQFLFFRTLIENNNINFFSILYIRRTKPIRKTN